MKIIKLKKVEHKVKIGKECPYIMPNISDDCLLEFENKIIGFYIKDISKYSEKLTKLLSICNKEFRSDNVPKQEMSRGPQGTKKEQLKR